MSGPQLRIDVTDRNGRLLGFFTSTEGSRELLASWRADIFAWLAEKYPAAEHYWFCNWT